MKNFKQHNIFREWSLFEHIPGTGSYSRNLGLMLQELIRKLYNQDVSISITEQLLTYVVHNLIHGYNCTKTDSKTSVSKVNLQRCFTIVSCKNL